MDYFVECFRSARQELLTRVRHRDDWLRIELLAQGALLALAEGIQIAGVRSAHPYPDVLSLAALISVVLSCCYFAEDKLVGYLSQYVGTLSLSAARLDGSEVALVNWDVSDQLRQYTHQTRPVRLLAQVTAFVIIPLGLTIVRVSRFTAWSPLRMGEVTVDTLSLTLVGLIIASSIVLRRQTGQPTRTLTVVPTSAIVPPEQPVARGSSDAVESHGARRFVILLWIALALTAVFVLLTSVLPLIVGR